MRKFSIAFIVVICIFLYAGLSWYFIISRRSTLTINLRSQVDGVSLVWHDQATFRKVIREIMAHTSIPVSLKHLSIRLVPNEQPQYITYSGTVDTGIHISSGNFLFSKETVYIDVYMKDVKRLLKPLAAGTQQTASQLVDAQVNEKVIKLLYMALLPPEPAVAGVTPKPYLAGIETPPVSETSSARSISEMYTDIVNRYGETVKQSIHLVVQ